VTSVSTNDQPTERSRWSVTVFTFGIALILLAFALYILGSPRGLVIGPRDVSLAERLILPLIIAAFPCCAVAPLLSRRPLKERLSFFSFCCRRSHCSGGRRDLRPAARVWFLFMMRPDDALQRFEGLGKPGEEFTGGKGLVNNQTESTGADGPTAPRGIELRRPCQS
jgi:hypothetical protein